MHQWPQYVIETVQGVVRPTLRRTVEPELIRTALDLLRTRPATVYDMAPAFGLKPNTLRKQLDRAGVAPLERGAGRGMSLYDWAQVRSVVMPAGVSPRRFLEDALRDEIFREQEAKEQANGKA
jgi:hypothetical protein